MRAGIEENAVAIGDHQRREAPFAIALIGRQHGGREDVSREVTLSVAEQASAAASKQAIRAVRLNIACYVNAIEEELYAAEIVACACGSQSGHWPAARHRARGFDLGGGGKGTEAGD